MKVFQGSNPNFLYKSVTEYILRNGEEVSPRGRLTKELQPAVNEWLFPDQMVITVPGRMTNPFFTLFESLWIAGGRADSESVCFYNSNLAQFLDEGFTDFHAPYGRRVRQWGKHKENEFTNKYYDQLEDVYNLLSNDKDTRQAVISLWIPAYDNSRIKTNDRPCNDMVFFKLRGNKLNMSVINRSNDLHWGLYSANIMQFSMMQRILASCLHVELGIYRHFSDSLHIYIDNDEISPRIINSNYEYNVYDYFKSYDLSNEYKNLADFDIKLSRFFYEEESLRKGINIIPNDFDIGKFLSGVLYILSAYVWHKKSHYEESLNQLLKAFDLGLCDHVISSLEFVMRKYQKIDNEFANKQLSKINKHFIDLNLNTRAVERTLHYIKTH